MLENEKNIVTIIYPKVEIKYIEWPLVKTKPPKIILNWKEIFWYSELTHDIDNNTLYLHFKNWDKILIYKVIKIYN